ncbi:MAG TPA: C40 family peptidase [Salinivirgaceae bacterium]|nr:C40 family peptidase [Salinivirgaceae bacterium]
MNKYLRLLFLLLLVAETLHGQDCLKNLERWYRKEKYRKIQRKSDKIIKKCRDNNEIYFYLAWAESVEGEKRYPSGKGYNNLLRGLGFYEQYQAELTSQRKMELKSRLMKLAQSYQSLINERGDTISSHKLKQILISVFGESTGNFYGKNDAIRKKIVDEARQHVGKPYRYGGKGPDSFDCSGFIRFVYLSAIGYELPGSSESQSNVGSPVDLSKALPADLVFFGDPISGKISHTAIVLEVENDEKVKLIHSTNRGVVIESTTEVGWENYWKGKLIQCRNIIDSLSAR